MSFEQRTELSEERTRELRALWRTQHANDIEIAAARRRFALGPPQAPLSFPLRFLGFVSAVVLLAGVAVAGAGVSRWVESRSSSPRVVAPVASHSRAPAKAPRARAAEPALSALQPSPDLPALSSSAVGSFAPLEPERAPARERVKTARRIELPAPEPANPQPAAVRGAWERLASDLRDGKPEQAKVAIDELTRSSDAATRDAALLVRAQLDLASGQRAAASATLTELAERGATEVIRKRARALLEREE